MRAQHESCIFGSYRVMYYITFIARLLLPFSRLLRILLFSEILKTSNYPEIFNFTVKMNNFDRIPRYNSLRILYLLARN